MTKYWKSTRVKFGVAAAVAGAAGLVFASSGLAQADSTELEVLSSSPDSTAEFSAMIDPSHIGDGGASGPIILLDESADASYWTSKDEAGNICIIVTPTGSDMVGMSCGDSDVFKEDGLFVVVESGPASPIEFHEEAYLIPDDTAFAQSDTAKVGLETLQPNLLVGDTRDITEDAVASTDGELELLLPQQ